MAFAGTHIVLVLDMENVGPSEATSFSSAEGLLNLIQSRFPGSSVHFEAFGDSEEFTLQQIDDLLKGGCYSTYIPGRQGQGVCQRLILQGQEGQGPGPQGQGQDNSEARRQLINKIFRFAYDHTPPAIIVVISGDPDFFHPLAALRYFGYTIVSIHHEGNVANVLEQVPHFRYYWSNILTGSLQGPTNQQPLTRIDVQQQVVVRNWGVAILWDFDTMGIRGHDRHKRAYQLLIAQLKRLGVLYNQNLAFNAAYGETINFPAHRLPGVTYRDTAPQPKENSIQNLMITDMLSFGFRFRPPSTVVVLTQDDKLTSTILTLKSRGFTTILCTRGATTRANSRYLRHAATHLIQPAW